jgi:uncharacterized protein YcsI (UPF0317 family)
LAEQRGDIRDLWRDDLVAFLLGCSLTVEPALLEAGVPVRNVARDTMVPMCISVDLMITHEPAQMFVTDLPGGQSGLNALPHNVLAGALAKRWRAVLGASRRALDVA